LCNRAGPLALSDESDSMGSIARRLRLLATLAALAIGVVSGAADTIEEKAAVCAACHGDNGVPIDKSYPNIFGQAEGYIYIELRDMKKGDRKNEQMAPIVETMSREDMLALAAYFAAKPWPNLQQPRASAADAKHFDSMAVSAQCVECHQAGYLGAGTQPRLAGQNMDYLVKTMLDFRDGARANNTWMRDLLKTFSEDDIKQMARVLAGM
jgi:cytochrome c553